MTDPLLPFTATPLVQAMDRAAGERISGLPAWLIGAVWNAQTCPVELLPWLAWAFSLNEWDNTWSEAQQRTMIANAVAMHRIKGTPASIIKVLADAGFPGAKLVEGVGKLFYDGTYTYNGEEYYGDPMKWAVYRVLLPSMITIAEAGQVIRLLHATAPARCWLEALDFTETAMLYDSTINYDGNYTYGTVPDYVGNYDNGWPLYP